MRWRRRCETRPAILGRNEHGWIVGLMEFDVEIVLRERDYAVTERLEHGTDPGAWRDLDVETVLKQILLAIDRARNPAVGGRVVALRGFSWIVEPMGE